MATLADPPTTFSVLPEPPSTRTTATVAAQAAAIAAPARTLGIRR
jgi:hypothetical protein